jgi:hypothetical protein
MSWKTIALITGALALSTGAYAADNPFLGTWKANLEKSHMTNPALINQPMLVLIAPFGDNGWSRVQIDVRDPLKSGREEHYSARFDGKDYPTNGGDPRVVVLTRVNERAIDQVIKRNGKESSRSQITVSADGKTLTSKGSGVNGRGEPYTDQVQVFDRVQ